jgi:hypothetical protein
MKLFRLRDGNYRNQKFNGSALLVVALVLACFAISPMAQAVVPAPDGGYPGGNTAEGQRAVLNLTTGEFNSALGFLSLSALTTGNFCTGVGAGALLLNTADGNTAVGAAALLSNTIGAGNTATGLSALGNNMDGIRNTANGVYALNHNISGGGNTAIGYQALVNNTASSNTAVGNDSLVSNNTGGINTAVGVAALQNNTTGSFNTAIGYHALVNNTGGSNIALGYSAGNNVTTANNVIAIGNGGADVDNSCFIGNIHGVTTAIPDAIPVLIDSQGQLGTMSSSRRFKKEIRTMDKASEAILALKPVTFHYKSDNTGRPQFGLIAEEVAEVNPDLVVRDKNGEIYTVRYDAVNAMLLNEFLKEHHTVQELEVTVAQQQKSFESKLSDQENQIEALTARMKKQAAQIQKVSGQIELNRPALQQVVLKVP